MSSGRTKSLVENVSELVSQGSPAISRAAYFIAHNPVVVEQRSIEEVAQAAGTAQSTIIRLCQSLGFRGYREFRLALAQEAERTRFLTLASNQPQAAKYHDGQRSQIAQQLERTIFESASQIDCDMVGQFALDLRQANRIVGYGEGDSNLCIDVLALRMMYKSVAIHVLRSGPLAQAVAQTLSYGDLAIGISASGLNKDANLFLETIRNRGGKTVAITTSRDNPLAKAADQVIELAAFDEKSANNVTRLLPAISLLTEYVAQRLDDLPTPGWEKE